MSENTTEQKEITTKVETVVTKEEIKENDSQPKEENQVEKENEEKEEEDDDKENNKEETKEEKKKESHSKEEKIITEEIEIQFEIDNDNYIITFTAKDKNFYFDIDLKKGNKYLIYIEKQKIDQSIIDYIQKLDLFLTALKENKEEDKIIILYEEIIDLYSKKKGYYLLISLFINLYEKKNLCRKLIEEFYKMNKDKKKDNNMDRKKELDNYKSDFNTISSKAEEIIKNYGYNPIYFYGVTFSYLNYYDYENFKKYFKKLNLDDRGVLYEILLIYSSIFLNPIEQDLTFFENFIDYTIKNKEFSVFESSLNYILYIDIIINVINKKKEEIINKYINEFKTIKIKADLKINKKEKGEEIKIFIDYTIKNKEFSVFKISLNNILYFDIIINIIDKKKEEIINKYNNEFKTIKIKADLKINKKEKGEEIKNIIEEIESIIDFSRKKQILFIYLNTNFWINILKNYNEENALNIDICYNLRGLLKNYYELIIDLFEKEENEEEKKIKDDIQKYLDKDEYAFILDKKVKAYIESNKKELSDSEILGMIMLYDPYYNEDKYQNSKTRVANIFDLINFNNIDNQFISTFKKLKFEEVFKEKITSFTEKILSKVDRNIYIFNNIIELIDINKLSEDKLFIPTLKRKFGDCIKKINSWQEDELKGTIPIIAKFVEILFLQEKNTDFLEKKIDKLDNNIKFLVYIEIIKRCQKDEYKQIKDFIFKKFLSNKSKIENLISFIDYLLKEDKIKFYNELLKFCLFTTKEFYSNYENPKITILIKLYEKGRLNLTLEDINFWDLEELLKDIKNEIDGDIKKKTLEAFLENGKEFVVKRLKLIKIILNEYEPEDVYKEKKEDIKNINEDIKELIFIKNSLLIYHRYSYLDKIQEITEVIKNLEEREIRYYKNSRIKEIIQNSKDLKPICEEVNIFKNNILFNAIYDEECGNDQKERFEEAKSKMEKFKIFILNDIPSQVIYLSFKNIFDKIKDILSNDYLKSEQLISQIKEFCKLKKNSELINDLIIIFKSKKYEKDLKSIFFFF